MVAEILRKRGKMRAFDYKRELSKLMVPEVVNALSAIHALRARRELRQELRPVELEGMREIARIQSTGASNSLENIRTSNARLRELVQMRVQPRNRDEREIAGYRHPAAPSRPLPLCGRHLWRPLEGCRQRHRRDGAERDACYALCPHKCV